MFNIKLVDIGGDGQVVDFSTTVDTLAEAEIIAKGEIGGHLGTYKADLLYDDDLVYEVMLDGVSVGVVAIESL